MNSSMADAPPDMASAEEHVIRVMPDALANKIAAGEVVQRPASAAKELIENALDAGASEIHLILKQSGRALIQVVDDGCGMSRADAARCFQRHATSKIQSIGDLERLRTLGFRGEALASIAAVAQVELRTRRVGDAAGTRVRIDGGEAPRVEPCAAPEGTSIAVRNLFFNVPVRRNFLKTPATEFKHLTETFQQLALANPQVAFALTHNDHEVFDLAPARTEDFLEALRHRTAGVLGEDAAQALAPVDDASSYLAVRGFVGAPERHRRARSEQFLFVNGRYVESRYLAHAVRTAYGDGLPEGAFPLFALFLTLDPRRVDVNVHPTKAEVKFDDQSGVYGFLRDAVRQALGARDLIPAFDKQDGTAKFSSFSMETDEHSRAERPRAARPSGSEDFADAPRSPRPRPTSFDQTSFDQKDRTQPRRNASLGAFSDQLYSAPSGSTEAEDAPRARAEGAEETSEAPVWQIGAAYVAMGAEGGLLVAHQQAAHRRVLYERALRRMAEGGAPSAAQQLLFPCQLDLDAAEAALLGEVLPELKALGFDLERFSGRTVVIRGLPADVAQQDEEALLRDVLAQYADGSSDDRSRQERLARSLAERGAVRTGQLLSGEEMRALLRDLLRCEEPQTAPDGRTALIRLSKEDFDERFGR